MKKKKDNKFNTETSENSSEETKSVEKILPTIEFPVLTCNSIELVSAQESAKNNGMSYRFPNPKLTALQTSKFKKQKYYPKSVQPSPVFKSRHLRDLPEKFSESTQTCNILQPAASSVDNNSVSPKR